MLNLEEYISKRKKESCIDEYNSEKRLENIRMCTDFVFDYFMKYLDVSESEMKSDQHLDKLMKYKKELGDYPPECIDWLLSVYDMHETKMNVRIKRYADNIEYFLLFYTEHEFREASYSYCDENVKKLPFIKDQEEIIYLLLKSCFKALSIPDKDFVSMSFLKPSTIDWLNDTYDKYSVNIVAFLDDYGSNFYDKTYSRRIVNQGFSKEVIVDEYNFKRENNLFEIDKLYKKIGYRPFIKGHKQELELLLMYYWISYDPNQGNFWNSYLERVLPKIKG